MWKRGNSLFDNEIHFQTRRIWKRILFVAAKVAHAYMFAGETKEAMRMEREERRRGEEYFFRIPFLEQGEPGRWSCIPCKWLLQPPVYHPLYKILLGRLTLIRSSLTCVWHTHAGPYAVKRRRAEIQWGQELRINYGLVNLLCFKKFLQTFGRL